MYLSRTTGKFKLVENGQIISDQANDEVIKFMEEIPVEVVETIHICHVGKWNNECWNCNCRRKCYINL